MYAQTEKREKIMHYSIEEYNITSVSYNSEMKQYVIVCDTELTEEAVSMMLGVAVEEQHADWRARHISMGIEDDGKQYFMVAN